MDCQLNVLIKNWFGISLGTAKEREGNDMEKINVKDQKMVYITLKYLVTVQIKRSYSIHMLSIQIDSSKCLRF